MSGILALGVGGLAVLHAQGQQQPTFRARIDLIQVNVVAVNEKGEHVYGLTAADFTLLDRGRPQAIATFQEVDAGRRPVGRAPRIPAAVRRDVASNQASDTDRVVVLVIDDLHVYKGRTDKARAIARDAVTKLAPGAFMAVLFTSGERSTEVTDDAARLLAAVDTLSGRQSLRRPNEAIDRQTPTPLDPEAGIENLNKVNASQRVEIQHFFDNMAQFETLENAARMLRLSPARRKAFVVVTEGIWFNPTGVYEEPGGDCVPTVGSSEPCYHWQALQTMMRSMRRSNVATYLLDPRGHVTSRQLGIESHPSPAGLLNTLDGPAAVWTNPVRAAQNGLRLMAEASGGFAVTDDDDLAGGLTRIVEDLDHYYLLGFYPADPDGPLYRPLEVKTTRPGLTLRFRRAYAEVGAPEPPKNGVDPLAQLITAALPSSDVPMRLHAIQVPTFVKDTRVVFALELSVSPRSQTAPEDRRLDNIRYGVFVADLKTGKVTRQFANTAQILLKTEGGAGEAPDTVRYQILTALDLPPGSYQVRASAVSETLAAGGSVFLPLTIADSSRRAFDLSDLALGFVSGPRTAVARDKTLTMEDSIRLPLEPTLDREFSSQDEVRLFASVVRLQPVDLTATVSVRTADGKTAFEDSLALPPREDVIDTVLPLAGLAPGAYVLRVGVTGGSGRVDRELAFTVR